MKLRILQWTIDLSATREFLQWKLQSFWTGYSSSVQAASAWTIAFKFFNFLLSSYHIFCSYLIVLATLRFYVFFLL